MQHLSNLCYNLLTYIPKLVKREGPPPEWSRFTTAQWPCYEAQLLIQRHIPPRHYPELEAVVNSDECVLCCLVQELF